MARSRFDTSDLATRMLPLDEDAFKEFGRLFGPKFKTYFQRHGLSPADAEDLSVSCVTDIALKIEQYRPREGASFSAWVFQISRNYLADWWRNHRPTESLPDDLGVAGSEGEEEGTESKGTLAVRDAIARMSEADQKIIQLRHFGFEHSYAEIGNHFGISADTARVRHFRALQRLEGMLEKDPRVLTRSDQTF